VSLERLLPARGPVEPEDAFRGLRLRDKAPEERPYVVLNMVSTADGRAAIAGRSGAIGDEVDRQLFRHLRTQTDAVLVGAGTARTERYGRLVRDPALRRKREEEGLAPDPLAVLVSGGLELPPDLPLFADPASRVVVLTGPHGRLPPDLGARVELLRGDELPLRLAPLLGVLRRERGIASVLCEGGPTLNASLLAEDLVDELFLTLAPKLGGGGEAPTVVGGAALATPRALELESVLRGGGSLFLRYRLRR